MLDKISVKAHAKINLFLRIMCQRNDGYHDIRTGVTFLDLHDEMTISFKNKNYLSYSGPFKPNSHNFKNDIILKVLKNISLKKNIKLGIEVKKNIPWQAGLGSASTNAASLIKALQKHNLIDKIDDKFLLKLGTDVPVCFYGQDCLVTGIGDKLNKKINFPKHYFILIKPQVQLSTFEMYNKLKKYKILDQNYIKQTFNYPSIHKEDYGNDFEKIAKKEHKEIMNLLDYLSNLDDIIFSRMTGSGSCCFAAFKNKTSAKKGFNLITNKFNNYWVKFSKKN